MDNDTIFFAAIFTGIFAGAKYGVAVLAVLLAYRLLGGK